MGMKVNSNHFSGTNGSRKGPLLKLNIQLFAQFPKNESQIKHIMRDDKGHLVDNSANRALLISLSEDRNAYLGKDKNGVEWFSKMIGSKQLWVSVRNGIIQNGGLNDQFVSFVPGEGLKVHKNIRRRK